MSSHLTASPSSPRSKDYPMRAHWSLADIPFEAVEHARVRSDEALFFVLASASLVESGTDVYADVLGQHFAADIELCEWLDRRWRREELQHGMALRSYVETVWPEFDWDHTFRGFHHEYAGYCSLEQLELTPALELVARCMIETGTSSLYKSISDYTDEPVLKHLAGCIRNDEARHYQRFLAHFHRHSHNDGSNRWQVLRALVRRLAEIDAEDADCALRHVFRQRYPRCSVDSEFFRDRSHAARALVMSRMPRRMVVKMALRPLDLPDRLQGALVHPVSKAMQWLFS